MKHLKLTGIMLLLSLCLSAQKSQIAVELTKMNVLYAYVENPITVAVSGVNPNEIIIKADNCDLKKLANGRYTIKPLQPEKLVVSIYQGTKLLEKKAYNVKNIPIPQATVGKNHENKFGGLISKSDLLKINELTAEISNFDFDYTLTVDSFSISVLNDAGETEKFISKTAKFTDIQKEAISKINAGQRLIIDNIYITMPQKGKIELNPIAIKIKN